ncbi:DUF4434 domain-containing protein [Motilimonas sp. KMU-193]|uniref:DUF4434 domain-containing protein n=1 Tax=Motilimonas sp. KMU-193 TaxID=3388668 RepID=UPI00396B210A
MVKKYFGYIFLLISLGVLASVAQARSPQLPWQPLPVNAWVVYQPQTRDMTLSETKWHHIFKQLQQQGAKGIVFQWSAFGSAHFNQALPETPNLNGVNLERLFDLAAQRGLKIKIGLYSDPAFFHHIKQSHDQLDDYLAELQRHSLQQAMRWQPIWQNPAFAGWYIPEEIDDYHWQNPQQQAILIKHLQEFIGKLKQLTPEHETYLSVYIGGHQHPTQTTDFFKQIVAQTKVNLWLQDGMGTQALSQVQRQSYFNALLSCNKPSNIGLIYEVFRQQSGPDETFSASYIEPEQWQQQLKQEQIYCSTENIVFSLRYLPLAKGYLQL